MSIYGDHYRLTVADLQNPVLAVERLNFILSRLQDRVDQLEGVRGTATVRAPMLIQDADGHTIHGFTETL